MLATVEELFFKLLFAFGWRFIGHLLVLAKYDKYNGSHTVAPVDRNAVSPEVIIWTASEALSGQS